MKWVQDRTGRFARRPHYLPEELDEECERIIVEFLTKKYGKAEFPVRTDDLTVLIEQKADLDSYADLSEEEGEVEGVTEFTPGQRPVVKIADRLNAPNMENRLRTTLTHEWGHVHFHQFMFDVDAKPRSLFGDDAPAVSNKCKRDKIIGASETDWMEWQAGYVCGAADRHRSGIPQGKRTASQQSRAHLGSRAAPHRYGRGAAPNIEGCRARTAPEETAPDRFRACPGGRTVSRQEPVLGEIFLKIKYPNQRTRRFWYNEVERIQQIAGARAVPRPKRSKGTFKDDCDTSTKYDDPRLRLRSGDHPRGLEQGAGRLRGGPERPAQG